MSENIWLQFEGGGNPGVNPDSGEYGSEYWYYGDIWTPPAIGTQPTPYNLDVRCSIRHQNGKLYYWAEQIDPDRGWTDAPPTIATVDELKAWVVALWRMG